MATIVFPHQLFSQHPSLVKGQVVYLVEEWLFFHQYRFHKQKLLLHRATMQMYADYLTDQGYELRYVPATDDDCDIRKLLVTMAQAGVRELHFVDVVDDWLRQRLTLGAAEQGIHLVEHRSPNFLEDPAAISDFFDRRKSYKQTDFYIDRRKHHKILLDEAGKSLGGQWTYDADNRLKFPKGRAVPIVQLPGLNEYVEKAQVYIQQNFPANYGSVEQPFDDRFFDCALY
jgi:deoxyribodipyrimidine photolyase-related protein